MSSSERTGTVSVLIPTRNRPLLAQLAVETALSSSEDDCEVIVADNSDVPLPLAHHPRLRHLKPTATPLSMVDNWERALAAAQGEWILLLSDKYMLVPGAIRALRREAAACGTEAVTYGYGTLRQGLNAAEELEPETLAAAGGELRYPEPQAMKVRACRPALAAVYRQAGRYPVWAPMLYTALVRRPVVERARRSAGRFFFGPCPDVASALQILAHADTYLETQLPAILAQYPSSSAEWSTGASAKARGSAGRNFLLTLGGQGRDPALVLISRLIFETLRAGQLLLPACAAMDLVLEHLAWEMAREIESEPLRRRVALHLALLKTTQWPRPRPAVAFVHARAALGFHAPGLIVNAYARLARRVSAAEMAPTTTPVVAAEAVGSRHVALQRLAKALT